MTDSGDTWKVEKVPLKKASDLSTAFTALNSASARLNELEHCDPEWGDIKAAWAAFIHDANLVWNRLATMMVDGKYAAWYNKLKQKRKEDDLLQYVHQSRHALEHGDAELVRTNIVTKYVGEAAMPIKMSVTIINDMGETVVQNSEMADIWETQSVTTTLLEVVNRGRIYPPPTSHLGEPIAEPCTVLCARLVVTYLEQELNLIHYSLVNDARRAKGMPPLQI